MLAVLLNVHSSPALMDGDVHVKTQLYPSQTKILDGRTNLSECVFEALFKGVSTRFGLQTVEKCFENAFGNVLPTSKIFVWGP